MAAQVFGTFALAHSAAISALAAARPLRRQLRGDHDGGKHRADHIGHDMRVDQQQAGDDQQHALPVRGMGDEIAVQPGGEQHDADRGGQLAQMMVGQSPIISSAGS